MGGAPEQVVRPGPAVREVAVLPGDHPGMRARACVAEGDRVRRGEPVVVDRRHPELVLTSPASGIVTTLMLGERRRLAAVVIALDGDAEHELPARSPSALASLDGAAVADFLRASGLWSAIRTRPAGRLVDLRAEPAAILVTAMDTNPLAADPRVAMSGRDDDFATGLLLLAQLTRGPIVICHAPGPPLPIPAHDRLVAACFEGPHPAGLPGTHVHWLCPVGEGRVAWHVGVQDVLALGRTFTTGRPDVDRVISIAGPLVREPRLARVPLGASVSDLAGEDALADGARVIAGSPLSGRHATGEAAWLGRHHAQVCVLGEPGHEAARERPFTAARRPLPRGPRGFTTSLHGRPTGFVPTDLFDAVFPLEIPATPLLRALAAGNVETAVELGCLDLDEEDLALLSFVCPAKHDHAANLRAILDRIASELSHG